MSDVTDLNLPDEHVSWEVPQWEAWSRDFTKRVADGHLKTPLCGMVRFAMDELLKCHTQDRFEELLDYKLSLLRRDLVNHWETEFVK